MRCWNPGGTVNLSCCIWTSPHSQVLSVISIKGAPLVSGPWWVQCTQPQSSKVRWRGIEGYSLHKAGESCKAISQPQSALLSRKVASGICPGSRMVFSTNLHPWTLQLYLR